MTEKKAVRVKIIGRVQGVNFRMFTSREADRHGITGWVMNRSDGSVEAYFEGDSNAVDSVVRWCREGPSTAMVNEVKVSEEAYDGKFDDFSIRYSE